MRRSNARTEVLNCDGIETTPPPITPKETAFEKQRGISRVETRPGFCQVHVSQLNPPLMSERLRVLKAVASRQVSIDFMKLTPTGISFLAPQELHAAIDAVLVECGVRFSIKPDRSIVLVHAVNIRDEEGLIAEIVQSAISTGAQIDHIGDGHDRLLLVVSADDARKISTYFKANLMADR